MSRDQQAAIRRVTPSSEPPPEPGPGSPRPEADGDDAMEQAKGRYVYCIIPAETDRDFGPIGIGDSGSRVYTLRYRNLAAVVSETPLRIYDPTRENVLSHELVNKTVMEEFTVIPMSFGTMFRTDEDITALLEATYEPLQDVLKKMSGRIELGLKVLWDPDRVVARLQEEDEEIRRLKEQITVQAASSTYFARVQLGRMVENALEAAATTYLNDIHDSLAPVATASRTNRPIGDRMIMNAAYLVDREDESEFDAAVKTLGRKYEDVLTFTYSGPWPPYNFVNVKLRLERADA